MIKNKKILFIDFGPGFGGSVVNLATILSISKELHIEPHVILDHGDEQSLQLYKKYTSNVFYYKKMHPVESPSCFFKKIKNPWIVKLDYLLRAVILTVMNIPFFLRVKDYASQVDPDIVQFNNIVGLEEFVLTKILKRKTVCFAQRDFYISKATVFFLKVIDGFVAVSEYVKNNLIEAGVPEEKTAVNYSFVDLELAKRKASEELEALQEVDMRPGIHIGLFGCLLEWKGQKVLIEAANIFKKRQQKHVYFYIVGSSPGDNKIYENKLKEKVARLDLKENIIFIPYVDNVYPLMNKMDIVVHASINSEPFGLVIIEAMSLGRAVIATEGGGPAEIIDDGHNGLLIQANNPVLLAESIQGLLMDEETRKRLGESALKTVKKKFSSSVFAEGFKKIYHE